MQNQKILENKINIKFKNKKTYLFSLVAINTPMEAIAKPKIS